MAKVTLILGPQGSGKTTKLNQLIKGKRAVKFLSSDLKGFPEVEFSFAGVERDTQVIAIDEVFLPSDLIAINNLIRMEKITICKGFKCEFTIARPELIITSQLYKLDDFALVENMELLEMEYEFA